VIQILYGTAETGPTYLSYCRFPKLCHLYYIIHISWRKQKVDRTMRRSKRRGRWSCIGEDQSRGGKTAKHNTKAYRSAGTTQQLAYRSTRISFSLWLAKSSMASNSPPSLTFSSTSLSDPSSLLILLDTPENATTPKEFCESVHYTPPAKSDTVRMTRFVKQRVNEFLLFKLVVGFDKDDGELVFHGDWNKKKPKLASEKMNALLIVGVYRTGSIEEMGGLAFLAQNALAKSVGVKMLRSMGAEQMLAVKVGLKFDTGEWIHATVSPALIQSGSSRTFLMMGRKHLA